MKKAVLVLSALLLVPSLFAVTESRPKTVRIGVLQSETPFRGHERVFNSTMPNAMVDELKKAGFDAFLVKQTFRDLQNDRRAPGADYFVEAVLRDGESYPVGGVGTGGSIGNVGVGGEVSVVVSHVAAEVRLYDASSLELLQTFELESTSTAPALTSVGLGDRYGFLYFRLPWTSRAPYRLASHVLARDAATKLVSARGAESR